MHPTLMRIALPLLAVGAVAACGPAYTQPHGGSIRAETAQRIAQVYRAPDGRIFPTPSTQDAYTARLKVVKRERFRQDIKRQRSIRRDAAILREERRLLTLERERALAEQRRAKADRAVRQARREARRAERDRRRQLETAKLNRQRAERAAIAAETRTRELVRRTQQIARRQARVDKLAPRQGLSLAARKKMKRFQAFRRPGENVPAFLTRIARAERRAKSRGRTVAHWLSKPRRHRID